MSQVYDPEWYVGGPDASRGPLSRPALLLLRALGALADDAPVWKPGLAAWTPAGEQPELASPDGGDAAPATDEATGWYVAKSGGTRTGPYADATLRELAGAGLLPADWLVWRHGQPDWSPAALAGFTPAPPIANADRSPVAAGSAAPPPLRPRGVAGPVATGTWPGAPSYPAGPDRAPLRPRRTSPGKVAIAAVGGVLFCCFAYVVGTGSAGRQIPERWPSAFATDAPAIAPDTTTPAYTEDLLHDMILAHNYMVAQQASLQHIKDGHGGAIGGRATGLRDHFERSFRPSVENIDRLLSAFEPTEWDAARSSAEQQLDAMLGPLSAAEAEAFLDEVEGRMNGTMEPGVFETLLTFHPLYRDYPEQEMHMGFTRQFLSDSLTTNPLAHVELAYPASWQAEASDQPVVLQNLQSENGRGMVGLSITTEIIPPGSADPGVEGMSLAEAEASFGGMFEGTVVHELGRGLLDQKPAVWATFSATVNQVGVEVDMEYLQVMAQNGDTIVVFTFWAGAPAGSGEAAPAFLRNALLFQFILNSVGFTS